MSREKQIKEIARVLCDAHEPCSKCVWGKCDVEHTAIRLYEAGYRRQNEWISVKDDTPKNGKKRVQVFLRDDAFTKPIGSNKIDTDRYIDGKWVRWGEYVTHWMPLPEPPKGE